MINVTIKLVCTKKHGTLSRLIRDIKLFGLIYEKHAIEHNDDHCIISITGAGQLNCTQAKLKDFFEDSNEIQQVVDIVITQNGEAITEFRTEASNESINPNDHLSPAILLAAEKRLAEIIGPVATYLVEDAAIGSSNCGELFYTLAKELNSDSERKSFLSIIQP